MIVSKTAVPGRPRARSKAGCGMLLLLPLLLCAESFAAVDVKMPGVPKKKDTQELRADYLTRLQEQYMPPADPRTVGSLWSAAYVLGDLGGAKWKYQPVAGLHD